MAQDTLAGGHRLLDAVITQVAVLLHLQVAVYTNAKFKTLSWWV